jgi:AraC-like DNA-binding protein
MQLARSSGLSPSIYMKRLLEVAAEHGVDPRKILKAIDMSPEALESGDLYYTIDQHVASLKAIQDMVSINGLGLLVGGRISIADLGILGYAMLSSSTFQKAIDVAIKFQSITDPVLHIRYRAEGEEAALVVEPLVLLGQAYRYDVEETLAIWQVILENFFGPRIGPSSVRVTWPDPGYGDLYTSIFRCPIVFEAETNEFRFAKRLLDQPLGLANDHAARICEEECARLLRSLGRGHTILDSVRRIMINAPGRFPDLPEVAAKLRLSQRNLSRRLAEVGTSFREISQEVRIGIAGQYLADTALSVEQIGFLVGYSEASNFHRAFKRCTGLTPLDYRSQHGLAGQPASPQAPAGEQEADPD